MRAQIIQEKHKIVSFYRFISFSSSQLIILKKKLTIKGEEQKIVGIILISEEGINATIAGTKNNIDNYLKDIENLTNIKQFFYKKSYSDKIVFKKLNIKIKSEIITSGKQTQSSYSNFYDLEPHEWESMLYENKVTILDIRNNYEIELGQFNKSQNLNITEFNEFFKKIKDSSLPKKQKTLLYCTGGIRCEKAITEMKAQGFQEVYNLKGGIINYLKAFPNKSFNGECFVFDHRVAVNQDLTPSDKYSLCPHCGQAAAEPIICKHCKKQTKICNHCLCKKIDYLNTCTKNCSHHFRLGHKYKKR